MAVSKKNYDVLDGLRGTAAIAVLMLHSGLYWGGAFLLHSAYLAVDMFFVLSGFVVAHAYESRLLDGLRFGGFVRIRLFRLAPLNALGLLLGITLVLGMTAVRHLSTPFLHGYAFVAALLNAAFLPALPGWSDRSLGFPFNGAAWSLFFEMFVNILYAATCRWLTTSILIAVCTLAGGALIVTSLYYGSLDVGIEWSQFPGGLARVMFSFPLGVLLVRTR